MAILEVIVGMVFTFLLLSLLGTTLNELLTSWRGWRGYYLEEALKRLLEFKDNKAVFEKFKDNPFYQQLMQHKAPLRVSQAPGHLSSSNFTSILLNVLKNKDRAAAKAEDFIAGLPEKSRLREVLTQLKDESQGDLEGFKNKLQGWFEGVMEQSSGWYKRHMQFITLFVGLGIAAVLNADSFQIYDHLTNNANARQKLNQLAEKFMKENETLPAPKTFADTLALQDIKAEVRKFVSSEEFSKTSNILGLGWKKAQLGVDFRGWLQRLLGWFLTALAISMGAPFWYEALKKLLSMKGSSSSSTQVVISTDKKEDKK
jgi:hypothetical protein